MSGAAVYQAPGRPWPADFRRFLAGSRSPRRGVWLRRAAALALAALAAAAVVAAARLDRCEPDEFLLGGIQVNEPDHDRWLAGLRREGMNAVAVTVYARQADWDGANLWFDETDEGVLSEIRRAKRTGLAVVLVLRLALDHAYPRNAFLWHGMVQPADDALLAEWFRRYRAFALAWAAHARREGVDLLAVGSELNALTATAPVDELPQLEEYLLNPEKQERYREQVLAQGAGLSAGRLWAAGRSEPFRSLDDYLGAERATKGAWAARVSRAGEADALAEMNRRRLLLDREWRRLVAAVREVYSGPLTYAANFDQYRSVTFWDAFDAIGINAYFPLREPDAAPTGDLHADLVRGWRRVLGEIDSFRGACGLPDRPVVFTEIGYTTRAGATLAPWAGTGFTLLHGADGERLVVWEDQPQDPRERTLALRALHEVHRERGEDLLRGLLYWKLSTLPEHAAIEPFVIVLGQGDPALAELRRFAPARRP